MSRQLSVLSFFYLLNDRKIRNSHRDSFRSLSLSQICFKLLSDKTPSAGCCYSTRTLTYPSSSGDHMMLGAMTIAILLALILFSSLFSESFPRNVIRYLRKNRMEKPKFIVSSSNTVIMLFWRRQHNSYENRLL